jgi:hypothetical protein
MAAVVSKTATTHAQNTLANLDRVKAGCVATIAAHNTPADVVGCIAGFAGLESCAYISKVIAAAKFKRLGNEQGYYMPQQPEYKDDGEYAVKLEVLYEQIQHPKKAKWGSFKQYLTAYNFLKRPATDNGGGGGENMTDEELIYACGGKSQHQLKLPNCVNLSYEELVVPDRTPRATPTPQAATVDISPTPAPAPAPTPAPAPAPTVAPQQALPIVTADSLQGEFATIADAQIIPTFEVPEQDDPNEVSFGEDYDYAADGQSDDEEETGLATEEETGLATEEVSLGRFCEIVEGDMDAADFNHKQLKRLFELVGITDTTVLSDAWVQVKAEQQRGHIRPRMRG